MKRRAFLAGILAAGALAGTSIRCIAAFKPKDDDGVALTSAEHPFSTDDMTFKCTERFSEPVTDWRAFYGSSPDLNAASLEMIEIDVPERYFTSPTRWYVKAEDQHGLTLARKELRQGLWEQLIGDRP